MVLNLGICKQMSIEKMMMWHTGNFGILVDYLARRKIFDDYFKKEKEKYDEGKEKR